MISKLSAAAALAAQASALTSGSANYDSSFTCTQCVVNKFKWCSTAANVFTSASSPESSKCIETSSSCSGSDVSLLTYGNLDLQLAACQQDSDVCGSTNTFELSSGTQTVAVANTMTTNTKCTYVVKTSAGFPLYQYKGTASDSSNLEISYMHYTADDRIAMDSTNAYFPSATTGTSSFNDQTSYSGTAEYPRAKTINGFSQDVSWADITTEMDTYLTKVQDYYTKIEAANAEPDVSFSAFLAQVFGLADGDYADCPEWIGEYHGTDLYNTLSRGGYGDPTSGVYTIGSTNDHLLYGKYGTSSDTNKNLDRNTGSVTRYVAISYIAKTGSVTTSVATGTVSLGTFDEAQKKYMIVEHATPKFCESNATWLKAGAMMATALSLII